MYLSNPLLNNTVSHTHRHKLYIYPCTWNFETDKKPCRIQTCDANIKNSKNRYSADINPTVVVRLGGHGDDCWVLGAGDVALDKPTKPEISGMADFVLMIDHLGSPDRCWRHAKKRDKGRRLLLLLNAFNVTCRHLLASVADVCTRFMLRCIAVQWIEIKYRMLLDFGTIIRVLEKVQEERIR